MWLGVDYYPEQWEDSLLEPDLDTIAELGCNIIRIAEFAWHRMEPREGAFDFSYFDRVIEKAKERGLKVILGTPTATIPAWLAAKYPSILSEFENGQKRVFGGRHVYCFHSPALYAYAERIIRAEVTHYRNEPAVVAWQIDNELGHEGSDVCYCPLCREAFRTFLTEKFHGDIEALNKAYGTAFWSQEYNAFEEIPTPAATITTHNPALRLDWERFRSEAVVRFAKFQRDLIKNLAPEAVVMHDFSGGGLEKHYDYAAVARFLDVVAYNNYPVWGGQREPLPPADIAFALDYMRGLKRENFWITEQIMGAQGHDVIGYTPRPMQAKLWSYQAFAHGCDSMMYFRYRGAVKGAEQFCYGLLDADNVKRRRFFEAKSFFSEIAPYRRAMEAPIRAKIAILYDYDSLAAFRIQGQSTMLDPPAELRKWYAPFYGRNLAVDVVPADTDLSGYEIVILPQMIICREETVARVRECAMRGADVVLTYRTAVKDDRNNLVFGKTLPLLYGDLAGVTVAESESLQTGQTYPLVGEGAFADTVGVADVFREMLVTDGAEVLYRYGDPFFGEYAAVTRKKAGRGTVWYVGCGVDGMSFARISDLLLEAHGIRGEVTEAGVEVRVRGTGADAVRMVMNHNGRTAIYAGRELRPYECLMEKISR